MLLRQLYGLYEQELWSSVVRFGAILLKMNSNQSKSAEAANSDAATVRQRTSVAETVRHCYIIGFISVSALDILLVFSK